MREVVWSPRARRADARLVQYLTDNADDETARRVHQRIFEAAQKLGTISTGRPGRLSGLYEKSVAGTSHIILYALPSRAGRAYVLILDIVHMSRNWPKGRWPPGS